MLHMLQYKQTLFAQFPPNFLRDKPPFSLLLCYVSLLTQFCHVSLLTQFCTTRSPVPSCSSLLKMSCSSLLKMMCKSKTNTDAIEPKTNRPSRTSSATKSSMESHRTPKPPSTSNPSTSYNTTTSEKYNNSSRTSAASTSSRTSLTSLRDSLPEKPHIYDFSEISTATNNFLVKRLSSATSSWRCVIRGKDSIVIQRKFRLSIEASQLGERLGMICKSHHVSLSKLRGASISGDHIYLVYDYINGANLAECLRNPKNPNFTILSSWISRMQVATDVAQGLEYIHHYTGLNLSLVHNHIKSSSVIITEPSLNAKICHFGTSELCGEINRDQNDQVIKEEEQEESSKNKMLHRLDSRVMKFEGTRGYMSPEIQHGGYATQKSDVYAFGVVMLELLSGIEPLKYQYDRVKGDYERVSVIETAREAIEDEGKLRTWIDRRLKDSFPVEVAEKTTRIVLECVDTEPDKRPDMRRVAGKISKLYLESMKWAEKMRLPTEFTVSFAGR